MRLPPEKIKEAIFNPDLELREAAVYYFARSCSSDSTLMPLVIQAFEQFGPEAFESFTFLDDLVQSDESVAWLIREVERVDPDEGDRSSNYFIGCVAALRHADAKALKPHEAAIESLPRLDESSKTVIAQRIFISSFTPDTLWQELAEFCEQQDGEDEISDDDYDFGCSIADALSSFPDQCAARGLEILKIGEEAGGWLEVMAVRLAGRLRLAEAVPHLVDLLDDPAAWSCEEAQWALRRIGTDSVVMELASRYATADNGLRMTLAYLLEDIHTDLSVQTCLRLLDQEQDLETRGLLIQSVLMNFSTEGIEPARQYVLSIPKCPEVLGVRHDLLVASKMMGVQFPEFEAWTEDSKSDKPVLFSAP
jgi:hypothetical protein